MRGVRSLLMALYGSALLGGGYALALAWVGLAPAMPTAGWRVLAGWVGVATMLAFAIGVPAFYLEARPVGRAIDQARGPRGLAGVRNLAGAQRRVLELPRVMGNTMLVLWLVPLVTQPACLLFAGCPPGRLLAASFVGTAGVGLVHATLVMYFVEWVARRRFVPMLVPDGRVSHFAGLKVIGVGWKLLFMFLTAGVFPMVALLLLHLAGTATTAAAVFLAVSSVLFGGVQSALIVASIARPIQTLHAAMKQARQGDLGARAPVLAADAVGRLNEGFNEMVEGLERAAFVKDTFGRYVTPKVRDEILRGRVSLGGVRCRATVLFSDIRGFTAWSETRPPEAVVGFLNQYLDAMVEVLVAHGATIDKFVGDAIMATFGVPVAEQRHALRAVRAAVAMLARLDALNAERARAGADPVAIGIGVHTGEVVAGNIGSARKMEYTVIGDTVNTASRIEGLCKHFGTRLLVSSTTHEEVAGLVTAQRLPPVEVKGKRAPLVVFEVTSVAPTADEITVAR